MVDLGVNDKRYHTISQLGHLIRVGDTILGYDLATDAIDAIDATEHGLTLALTLTLTLGTTWPAHTA